MVVVVVDDERRRVVGANAAQVDERGPAPIGRLGQSCVLKKNTTYG